MLPPPKDLEGEWERTGTCPGKRAVGSIALVVGFRRMPINNIVCFRYVDGSGILQEAVQTFRRDFRRVTETKKAPDHTAVATA